MKLNTFKVIILFTLLVLPLAGNCQSNISLYNFTFEDTTHEHFMYRDTISNPNCIWQIGAPQKTVFTSSQSLPNSIITDTLNPYPINDTSSFIIKHEVGWGYLCAGLGTVKLSGSYYVNSDSLNDFGIIEFSPDNGITWVLITTGPNAWPYSINAAPPIFTGNSGGWKYFNLSLDGVDGMYNFQPLDTVQYKFTFISDGNLDNKDGLMFDNLAILDICTIGTNEYQNQNTNAYPNPFTTTLNLNYEHLTKGKLFIYDMTGKLVHSESIKNSNSTTVSTSTFNKGIYFYKIVDAKTGLSLDSGKVVK